MISLIQENSPTLSVGIVSADLFNLKSEVSRLEKTPVKLIHFDVMDGCFTPVLTIGVPFIKAIRTTLLKDVHLMIVDPLEKVADYAKAGADIITVHTESCQNIGEVLKRMDELENVNNPERKILKGLAINPSTSIDTLGPYLNMIDIVTLLAIDPTIKGAKTVPLNFMEQKCQQLENLLSSEQKQLLLCVDGGVKQDNIDGFSKLNANVLVSGSALYKENQLEQNIEIFLGAMKQAYKAQS